MFEEEAKEYRRVHGVTGGCDTVFKEGAEFGYNKAKEDADKMKSRFLELCNLKDMRIAELEKANKWHYVKDGDLPKHDNDVLVLLKDETTQVDYYFSKIGWNISINADVIAWKEIVLPELKESE